MGKIKTHSLALLQLLLSAIKVEVNIETFEKLGNRIPIGVRLLLNELNKILQHVSASLVGDNGSGQVSQNVRANSLDSIAVVWLIEKQIDNAISPLKKIRKIYNWGKYLRVIEEDKQTPMNEPRALLQLFQRGDSFLTIDKVSQRVQILKSSLPITTQENVTSKLSPQRTDVFLRIDALQKLKYFKQLQKYQNAEVVQILGSETIVSTIKLKLGVVVEGIQHFGLKLRTVSFMVKKQTHIEVLLQKLKNLRPITRSLDLRDNLRLFEQSRNGGTRLLVLIQLFQYNFSLFGKCWQVRCRTKRWATRWYRIGGMKALVNLNLKIDHVRLRE